jgi:hypothetical protein
MNLSVQRLSRWNGITRHSNHALSHVFYLHKMNSRVIFEFKAVDSGTVPWAYYIEEASQVSTDFRCH